MPSYHNKTRISLIAFNTQMPNIYIGYEKTEGYSSEQKVNEESRFNNLKTKYLPKRYKPIDFYNNIGYAIR